MSKPVNKFSRHHILNPIPVAQAFASGAKVILQFQSSQWSKLLAKAYQRGYVLLEMEEDRLVGAYQKP